MTELGVGSRVIVSNGLAFGGGSSPWVGRIGTVKKLLRGGRAVLVKLDDDDNRSPFLFFARELDLI